MSDGEFFHVDEEWGQTIDTETLFGLHLLTNFRAIVIQYSLAAYRESAGDAVAGEGG